MHATPRPRAGAPRLVRRAAFLALALFALLPAAPALRAQSEADIMEQLRASGLTREQVRDRLQQMGKDPALADRYFDAIEHGGTPPQGQAGADVVNAMHGIGVMLRQAGAPPVTQTTNVIPESVPTGTAAGELPVFGRDLFRIATSQFQAVASGPVDPGYRLGPGDQVVLVLTGDVDQSYTLDVNREGMIVIPDVGQVYVAGMTIRELEDRLYERLGRIYSGVGRGQGATTQFSVSMGQLRSNQVFLVGEVERPGAYQVSAVATVFNALYLARGPNDHGSFRNIEVRRGGRTIRTIDVYDYLLHGDASADVRLEQGDMIYVPLAGPQVGIKGSVRRQARFELKPGEGLRELIAFAGGLEAQASVARIQIDRVLPPEQRRPGTERTLIDVDLREFLAGHATPQLFDGDLVSVFSVLSERRNRLTLNGEVRRPGVYEWQPGLTLWGLIDRAEGLNETAYTARAHVYRYNPEDGSRSLIRAALYGTAPGTRNDLALADRDSVVIFSRAELRNPQSVAVAGYVKTPGSYTLAEGMTSRDLILAAGGFAPGADETVAELARLPDPRERTSTTAQVYYVSLGDHALAPGEARPGVNRDSVLSNPRNAQRGAGEWTPSAAEMPLQDGDVLFVRRAPGWERPRVAVIQGEVAAPGEYSIRTRDERLIDLLQRAGGPTPQAYLDGVRVTRGGTLVGASLTRAMRRPRSRDNIVIENGDTIVVPSYDPTVVVTGAVNFQSRVLYDPHLRLEDYVSRSGGYANRADKSRVSVRYPDGELHTVQRTLVFANAPAVKPGSTIYVPVRPEGEKTDWGKIITGLVSAVSAAATLWVAIDRLSR